MSASAATIEQISWPVTSTTDLTCWQPLVQGPYWSSFEQFRQAGSTALEGIRPGVVATLNGKSAQFRILRDEDFQRLIGLAAEVHRIKNGVTIVMKAAKLFAKHKDEDSIELLISSVSMLNECRALPEHEGHGRYVITPEEAAENTDEDIVPAAKTPRPKL